MSIKWDDDLDNILVSAYEEVKNGGKYAAEGGNIKVNKGGFWEAVCASYCSGCEVVWQEDKAFKVAMVEKIKNRFNKLKSKFMEMDKAVTLSGSGDWIYEFICF
jgi:hypothetical protein